MSEKKVVNRNVCNCAFKSKQGDKYLKKLSLLPFFFCFVLIATNMYSVRASNPSFVSLSIILDTTESTWNEVYYNALKSFLENISYTKWTFAIWQNGNAQDLWVQNETRINLLKTYGKVIPRVEYIQRYTNTERMSIIDSIMAKWINYVGYYPKGINDFTPDTFTANYIRNAYGCAYYQGYCFEQYRIDYMSMRGGWQLPYYADNGNILKPDKYERGIIVFPHVTWDWVNSLTKSHHINTHPQNLLGNYENAKEIWFGIIERNSQACSPFSLSVIQFEWKWHYDLGYTNTIQEWINELLTKSYTFEDFENIAKWFTDNYEFTPTYSVNYKSPFYPYKTIEWLYTTDYRIARVENQIVSYINYSNQANDKYLITTQPINWGKKGTPCDSDNQIDTSLTYEIDALGGGYLRSSITTEPFKYQNDLAKFPDFYAQHKTINLGILPILLGFGLVSVCVGILFRKKRGIRKCGGKTLTQ